MADENTAGASAQVGGTERVTIAPDADAQAQANLGTPPEKKPEEGARPEGLPEGFDSWEAYGKDAAKKAAAAGKAAEEAKAKEGESEKKAPEGVDQADPRLEPYTAELTEKGALAPESVGKAAAEFLGEDNPANRAIVENYVEMMLAQANAPNPMVGEFYGIAGSPENYSEFSKWAEEGGISAEKLASYNKALDTDPVAAKELLKGYVSEWKATGAGTPARDITSEGGGQGNSAAGDTYASWAQVTKDMNDARYTGVGGKRDPAFIKGVEDKLGRSKL